MKKYIIGLLCIGMCAFFLTSCLEKYLDQAPESGLTEKDVFSKLENFKKFFDSVYDGGLRGIYPLFQLSNGDKTSWEQMTDLSDQGRITWQTYYKFGPLGDRVIQHFNYGTLFTVIRKCNLALKNINLLTDASQTDIDDLIGQAHFVRAFAHFELFRIWGPMPYITKVIGPYDQWDIPRLSKHETCLRIAADMDTAATFFAKANLMRRDPGPGLVGHLSSPDQFRPNGVAAKAFKGRALLYAASPLNNELGAADWQEAAKANWEAILIAQQYGYTLLSAGDYKKNYVGTTYTNEQLWGWYGGTYSYTDLQTLVNGPFSANKAGNAGECPTQNTVDKFETAWGEPLNTQADRDAATLLGHYNEQDPYVNRDPRFYIDIIFNTCELVAAGYGTAKIYYEIVGGATIWSELTDRSYAGVTRTGYYQRKRWGDQSVKNQIRPQLTDPLIRLGELYLNYAEAANEAYGPNTVAPTATMTAVEAINFIRARIGQLPVLAAYTGSTTTFRPRIKNERTVELCFEGNHYFCDIRRWMDAPAAMSSTLMGADIEKVPVIATYPTGYRYTRLPLAADRQPRWIGDAMYYFPFLSGDNYKMKNFITNEVW